MVAGIDEALLDHEPPRDYVMRLAEGKARAVAARLSTGIVLGADTTVAIDEHILGQPLNDADAKRMLMLLSGKWHKVLTGVALVNVETDSVVVDCETTRVLFAEMSSAEIDWYVASGEPMGKAGAYGIQGKASLFIEAIEGDYFNVVGLPIRLVYEMFSWSDLNVR
jgi:septum formation protein